MFDTQVLIDTDAFTRCCSGQDFELLDWLENVTFPTETKFHDATYARRVYESVVTRTLNSGVRTESQLFSLLLGAYRPNRLPRPASTPHCTRRVPTSLQTSVIDMDSALSLARSTWTATADLSILSHQPRPL